MRSLIQSLARKIVNEDDVVEGVTLETQYQDCMNKQAHDEQCKYIYENALSTIACHINT